MTETTDWHNCYDNGWKGLISDAAFAHPAKFSRNLIFRIIEHLLADGVIQPGDTIIDPFGGVALGALPSVSNGLNWIGCELERKFVDMGAGMDCGGMSRAEWVRFYGRWGKVNYRDDWHWCPDCVTGAGRVSDSHKLPLSASQKKRRRRIQELEQKTGRQVTLFDRLPFPELTTIHKQAGFFEAPQPSTDYRRDGRIPHSHPHHYIGNVELFAKYAKNGATARLLQGDSRRLAEVVSALRLTQDVAGVVGSPPFQNQFASHDNFTAPHDTTRLMDTGFDAYGQTPGQLAALPPGQPPAALVSSPPFAGNTGGRGEASRNGIDAALFDRHGGGMKGGTGSDPANLDNLPMGVSPAPLPPCPPSALVSSPPFAGSVGSDDPARRGGLLVSDPKRAGDVNLTGSYGQTPGQLGGMRAGAVISSPPFENQEPYQDKKFRLNDGRKALPQGQDGYGSTPGQIGTESGETFWTAAHAIVSQCALLLPPGAFAIWVVKSYVKGGKLIDFPGQWQALCEACGFETVHVHRAWLVKRNGAQATMDGGAVSKDVARKSFFRRLAESKGSPAIDFETVLCTRKRG